MAQNGKDTIYIDVDDEITAIVDKLQASDSKIVALVLPKRAAALQSIVNMKLLKRAADEAGKNPVLITSETGLLPLAGATGIHVAKNLQSKPEVPPAPESADVDDEELEADVEPDAAEETDDKALAGAAAGAAIASDTIDMEKEDPVAAEAAKSLKPKKAKASKAKGGKKPKVPNFEKFRKKLFLIGAAVVALIVFWYFAVFVMPKATIAIQTNTESIDTSFNFTASPSAQSVDIDNETIPAKLVEEDVSESQTAPATGQKDMGTKASGTVSMSIPCSSVSGTPPTVPKGTGVSANGNTYITQSSVSLTNPSFNGGCNFTGSTKVVARENGDQYNQGATSYTVAGFSNINANGSAMTGGSSRIVKVVSAQDVESAKSKLDDKDEAIKTDLQRQLEDEDYFVIKDSFKKSDEATTVTPNVGQEGSEVKVTYTAKYSMMGIKRDDLKKLIENSLKDEIDVERQAIQNDGLDNAKFVVDKTNTNGDATISVTTTAEVGPDINQDALREEIAGKKRGETENIVKALPGVNDVQVKYSPFWVSRTPKKPTKITIEFTSANN